MNSNAKVVKTNDGSHTIFLPDMNEHYHSLHGARQESEHVYIKKGLHHFIAQHPNQKKIKILEIGFGTGLNALLTLIDEHNEFEIEYHTLEPFPIEKEQIELLNFNFKNEEKILFDQIHNAEWEQEHVLSPNFSFKKIKSTLEDFTAKDNTYNIVYFDAFAPNKQKNIWSSGNFFKLYSVLVSEAGILVTYCAQGEFKRTAKNAGFQLEEIDGPPGKREMIRLNK